MYWIRKFKFLNYSVSSDFSIGEALFGGKNLGFGIGTVDINIDLIWNI